MIYNRLLNRKILYQSLENIYAYPLTLVVAPMGYGKTTALLEFADHKHLNISWFTFEIEETSPKYIWDTFARQLKKLSSSVADRIKEIGFPFTTLQRNKLLELIEEITRDKPIFIAIDDYHLNYSSELDDFIRLLVSTNIKNLHLIILSRTTPELGITELVLKHKCYKVNEGSFSLSLKDVGKLYRLNKVPATNEIIEKTYQLSEGWISATLLLIELYKDCGRIDSVERIEELIKTTFMKHFQSKKSSVALLGIMDVFSRDQLIFMLGKEEALALISEMERAGAFIRYDEGLQKYFLHNIFVKYLYDATFKDLPEDLQEAYYQKLGLWHIKERSVMAGIRCFQKSKSYDLILKEFEKITIMKVFDYYPEYVHKIMESIPKTYMQSYPVAYLCYLHFLVTARDLEHGIILFREFVENKDQLIGACDEAGMNLEGELNFLRGLMAYNTVENMFDYMEAAVNTIKGPSITTRPDKMPCAGSISVLYMYHRQEGNLEYTAHQIQEKFKYYELLSNRKGTGIEDLVMAEYYLETGQIEKAERHVKRSLHLAKILPQLDSFICGMVVLSRIYIAKGLIEEASNLMASLAEEIPSKMASMLESIRSPYYYAMDNFYIKSHQLDQVTEDLRNKRFNNHMLFFQSKGIGYILYGHYLLAKGAYEDLEWFCSEMNGQFNDFNYLFGHLHSAFLEGIACYQLYGMEEARSHIERAIEIGRKDNIKTTIMEYGEAILPLLKEIESKDAYINSIIKGSQHYANLWQAYSDKNKKKNIILTPRESDVMIHLCQGKRNAEIASALFVSESAVKKTLSLIYKKYGVKSRMAAIKAYELEGGHD